MCYNYLEVVKIKPDSNLRIFEDHIFEELSVTLFGKTFPRIIEVPIIAIKSVVNFTNNLRAAFIPILFCQILHSQTLIIEKLCNTLLNKKTGPQKNGSWTFIEIDTWMVNEPIQRHQVPMDICPIASLCNPWKSE